MVQMNLIWFQRLVVAVHRCCTPASEASKTNGLLRPGLRGLAMRVLVCLVQTVFEMFLWVCA